MLVRLLKSAVVMLAVSACFAPSWAIAGHGHGWGHRAAAPPAFNYGRAYHSGGAYYGFSHRTHYRGSRGGSYLGQVHSHRGYYGNVWEWGHRLRY